MSEILFSHSNVRIWVPSNNSKKPPQSVNDPIPYQSVTYTPDGNTGSTLSINLRPNQIQFGYGLNTKSFPTYAGEVVQILSAYIDNLTIEGDIRTYRDMELIYKWFVNYMTIATQGVTGHQNLGSPLHYDDSPVTFSYPHRNWTMQIRPLSLPNMTYGTEVVVPSWSMEAAIVENENLRLTKMLNSDLDAAVQQKLKKVDANFGIGVENPFNYWSGSTRPEDIKRFLGGVDPIVNADPNNNQLTNWFSNLVANYSHGNVDLTESSTPFSRPYTVRKDVSSEIQVTPGGSSNDGLGSIPEAPTQGDGALAAVAAAKWLGKNSPTFHSRTGNADGYEWGGGHGKNELTDVKTGASHGLDCSGAVCWVLREAGMYVGSEAEVSGDLAATFGDAGKGKYLTVWANAGHTFIEFTVPGVGHMQLNTEEGSSGWYHAWDSMAEGHATSGDFTARKPKDSTLGSTNSGGSVSGNAPSGSSITNNPLPARSYGPSRNASDIKIIVLHDSEIHYTSDDADLTTLYNSLDAYFVYGSGGTPIGPPDYNPFGLWPNPPQQDGEWDSCHIGINGRGHLIRMVPDLQIAHHVYEYNKQSLGIEQIGIYTQTASEWPDAQLNMTAWQISQWAKQYNIPIVHSTTAGVCMHSELGASGGNHQDPGAGYPFDAVLAKAKQFA